MALTPYPYHFEAGARPGTWKDDGTTEAVALIELGRRRIRARWETLSDLEPLVSPALAPPATPAEGRERV